MPASREEIWAIADEILASGTYPTNAAVRDRAGCSMNKIQPVMSDWRDEHPREEWEKQRALVVQQSAEIGSNGNGNGNNGGTTTLLEEQQRREDADNQIAAARNVVAKTYYEKTGDFNLPGLAEEVKRAQSEIHNHVNGQKEAVFPKWMSDRLNPGK